jgi:hypothetical protein
MTAKVIIVDSPNGRYVLPVGVVAHDRAGYYQGRGELYSEVYDETYKDNYEIIDWLLNNMDWEDVVDQATKFSDDVLILEEDFWTNSDDFEIRDDLYV